MKYCIVTILLLKCSLQLVAQSEIEFRNDALILPRISTGSVTNPEKGMIIFDTIVSEIMTYDGISWKILSGGCSSTGSLLTGPSVTPMCCEEQLTNGFAGSNFGETVALDGKWVLTGLPGSSGGGKSNIFKYDTTSLTWDFETSLSDTDLNPGDSFGESLDIDGDRAVIGAPKYEEGSEILQRGGAFVYWYNNGSWSTSGAPLNNNDEEDFSEFGSSVAIDGEWIVSGSPKKDVNGSSDQGKIYFFKLNGSGNTWQKRADFTGSDSDAGDRFGSSVALEGSTAIVGAPFADDGKVYVFKKFGTVWGEHTSFTPDVMNSDDYGSAVAISGDYFVVGAPGENNDQGAAYIYKNNGSTWEQVQKLTSSDGVSADVFGTSVSIRGDYIIVGAPQNIGSIDTGPGKAYIFQFNGTTWNEIEIVTDPIGQSGDQFGFSVSTDSANRVIGAPKADPNGFDNKGKISIAPVDK